MDRIEIQNVSSMREVLGLFEDSGNITVLYERMLERQNELLKNSPALQNLYNLGLVSDTKTLIKRSLNEHHSTPIEGIIRVFCYFLMDHAETDLRLKVGFNDESFQKFLLLLDRKHLQMEYDHCRVHINRFLKEVLSTHTTLPFFQLDENWNVVGDQTSPIIFQNEEEGTKGDKEKPEKPKTSFVWSFIFFIGFIAIFWFAVKKPEKKEFPVIISPPQNLNAPNESHNNFPKYIDQRKEKESQKKIITERFNKMMKAENYVESKLLSDSCRATLNLHHVGLYITAKYYLDNPEMEDKQGKFNKALEYVYQMSPLSSYYVKAIRLLLVRNFKLFEKNKKKRIKNNEDILELMEFHQTNDKCIYYFIQFITLNNKFILYQMRETYAKTHFDTVLELYEEMKSTFETVYDFDSSKSTLKLYITSGIEQEVFVNEIIPIDAIRYLILVELELASRIIDEKGVDHIYWKNELEEYKKQNTASYVYLSLKMLNITSPNIKKDSW